MNLLIESYLTSCFFKMKMPRCPNCNYSLVLLEHRRKYKCAKCGKLFPQKEIEDKEFREFNKKRREESKKESKKEYKKLYAQENRERISAWMREYYEKNKEKIKEQQRKWVAKNPEKIKEYQRKYRGKNHDKINAQKRGYWASNHEHLLVKRKENYQKRKPEILRQQALYRENNKTLSRIKHLRDQQKALTLKMIEFNIIIRENAQFQRVLPTLALS